MAFISSFRSPASSASFLPFSSPSFSSPPFSSPAAILNSWALALFLFTSSSSLLAASSRRRASASYSEKYISNGFNIKLLSGEAAYQALLCFDGVFLGLLLLLLPLGDAHGAGGAGGESGGLSSGASPKHRRSASAEVDVRCHLIRHYHLPWFELE